MQGLTLTLSDCAVELSVWKRGSYVTSADVQLVSLYVCDGNSGFSVLAFATQFQLGQPQLKHSVCVSVHV